MNLDSYLNNPLKDGSFESKIPEMAGREACIVGIDEAGRGPVLGPMVYGLAYCPLSLESELKKLEFADSKTLTEEKRENIFEKLGQNDYQNIGWFTTVLSPVTISNSMFKRSKYNLNSLSHDTAIGLIRLAQQKGINVKKVFVDTVGPADKYEAKLKALFPGMKIKVANKADSLYPIVSASSICAKVIRDRILSHWKFVEPDLHFTHKDFGSGYPSDPKTKQFLSKTMDQVFGYSTFVRFSWSTVTNILDDKAIECQWEEEEEEEVLRPETKSTKKISSYFSSVAKEEKPNKKQKVNSFFKERNLKFVNHFN